MANHTHTQDWQVEGLDCPSCVAALERACRAVPGVLSASASLAAGRLRVTVDPQTFDAGALRGAARRAGHPLWRVGEPRARAGHGWPFACAACLFLGVGAEAFGRPLAPLYLLATLVGAAPLLPKAWAALALRAVTVDVLMSVAMLGALALGDWREAAVLALLFAVAQALERASLARASHAVEALLALAPRRARVERGGELVDVAVEEVRAGERIRVRPGDLIPLDGTVESGASAVDEATITGESVPATKSAGDRVFAATLALDGALTIRVSHRFAHSTLARVVALVEEAEAAGSPTQRVVDRFAAWYTPAIIGLAAAVSLLPPLCGAAWHEWVYRGLVLLVIGCPCALVIATPVAVASGLTAAARCGMLVRGGAVLEAAAGLRAVAFDKTGTLTVGRPHLAQVVVLAPDLSEDGALALAGGLEAESSHPLARALVAACAARGVQPVATTDHRVEPGRGVVGSLDGEPLGLGGPGLLGALGVDLAAAAPVLDELEERGLTAVVLANREPLAVFALSDTPRAEAAGTVATLRSMGLTRLTMLTGDHARAARAIASQVGLDEVYAELLPADKLTVLAELTAEHGPTAMVGDGINDAPALAAASVGIALGAAGSDIALETADVALLGNDLRALPALVALARRVRATIVANIAIALLVRLVLVPLAVLGHAGLWLAIVGDMGGSLAVTAHSLRLLRR